jgi:hypothetical protein
MKLLFALAGIFIAGFAHAAELRMDESVCQQVVKHVPEPGVAYQPGVDVNGHPVAPADLNASPINKTIEKQIAIRIYNDAAKTFGLPVPSVNEPGPPDETPTTKPLVNAETEVGYITFRNGQAYLNGQPLNNDQQDQLAVLCIKRKTH